MRTESHRHIVFATEDSIERTAVILSGVLAIDFSVHDSLYRGGGYLRAEGPDGEVVIVQQNDDGGEPAEDVAHPTLIYVENTNRGQSVCELLADSSLVLLRA
jgi:hypothetical protein